MKVALHKTLGVVMLFTGLTLILANWFWVGLSLVAGWGSSKFLEDIY